MAKSTDMFNDKYTYLDLHLMFDRAVEEAYYKVQKEFYDKYGWIHEFYDECDFDDGDNFVCLGDNTLCDKHCKDCPCAHPVEEFL